MPPPPVSSDQPLIVIRAASTAVASSRNDDHEFGRDRLGFLPIRAPELVARPHLSYRHADDHRI